MSRRMGLAAAMEFTRRMGTAFRAGVDIVSLCRAESRHGSSRHQQVMSGVAEAVAGGSALADAMQQAGSSYFPRLLLSMVHLGEQTGRLERTLLQMAEHYRNQLSLRRLFLLGIAWPAAQLAAAILVIGLLIWLIGTLQPPSGGEMFDPTGFGLRGVGGVAIYFGWVAVIFGSFALVYVAVRNNWFNLHAVVPLFYLVPKIGPAIQTITLARFCWTLSLALDAGLDPMRSVSLALDSTGSDYYRSESETAEREIRNGKTLGEALAKTQLFPNEFLNSLEVAEVSGTDSESLASLAAAYEERAKIAVRTLAGLATAAVWLIVAITLITMILRMAFRLFGAMHEATQF